MPRERNTESKRTKSPQKSFLQSASAQVMVPRLLVILSTLVLVVVGLVMVYSSSSITSYVEKGDALGDTLKQCIFAVVGILIAVCFVLFARDRAWRGTPFAVFYVLCLLGLAATALFGTAALGAKRWLVIGPISIQVAEFAKIAIVLLAALMAEQHRNGELGLQRFLIGCVLIGLPLGVFILLQQSDMGTTMICFVGILAVIFFSGLSRRATICCLVAMVLVAAILMLTSSYRAARFFSFLDPWADAQGSGYQVVHSFQALASGGFFGVGIGNSYEKLQYLPEAETDFIFAIIGEELGFVGGAIVILAFVALLWGGFRIARQARTSYMGMAAAGLTVMIVFQAFLNIACVMGVAPITGKPLPFISSGGSSLISSLMLVGILLSVSFDSSDEGEYRQRRDNLRVVSSAQGPYDGEPLRGGGQRGHGGYDGNGCSGGRRQGPNPGQGGWPRNGANPGQSGGRIRLSESNQHTYSPALGLVQAPRASAYATQARTSRAQRR